jgi:hypothetical protein
VQDARKSWRKLSLPGSGTQTGGAWRISTNMAGYSRTNTRFGHDLEQDAVALEMQSPYLVKVLTGGGSAQLSVGTLPFGAFISF